MNRFTNILVCAAVSVGLSGLAYGQSAKDDIKDAGRATKRAAKKTGSAVKKTTKKAVHETAKTVEKGADKVKDKTHQ